MKKIVSLIIVVTLLGCMLTGCSFIPSLVKRVVQERPSDEDDGDDKVVQGESLSPEIEAILTADDVNPVNELLYKIYKTEYQPSLFAQDDAKSDTTKWICATYAIYNYINNKDLDEIGGYWEFDTESRDEKRLEKTKKYLSDSCGVDSRVALVEVICVLLNFGNNARYNKEAQEMIANGDITANLVEKYGRGPEVFRKMAVQRAHQRFGENGLVGWDLSRANQILGDAYYAGYINLEESLDLSLLISKRIQNTFKSWDEFFESDLYGSQFFRQDAPDNPTTETANRWDTFDTLKEWAYNGDGPLVVPFETKLVRSWDEEEIAVKKRAEEEPLDEEMPVADEEELITFWVGGEEGTPVRMRIPDGFTMTEDSTSLVVYATSEDDAVSILYNSELSDTAEAIKARLEEQKKYGLELAPNDSKIIVEQTLKGEDEATYYYAMETNYAEDIVSICYMGYKIKKIDDKWVGIYAQLMTDASANITEEVALSLMFSDVQFP